MSRLEDAQRAYDEVSGRPVEGVNDKKEGNPVTKEQVEVAEKELEAAKKESKK